MSARGTALALALVLLAGLAPSAPRDCCAPGAQAPPAIRAVDCCAAMLECPAPRIFFAVVQGADSARGARLLVADSAGLPDAALRLRRPADSEFPLEPLRESPPLYRLHAQLLI